MKSGIYKITNTITNDIYIGATKNLPVRFSTHRSKIKNNCHPNRLIKLDSLKYGHEAFILEVLEYCSIDDLYKKEIDYIQQLNPSYNVVNTEKIYKKGNTPRRILLDVAESFHKEIKIIAINKNMSIKNYLIRAVLRQIQEDNKYE